LKDFTDHCSVARRHGQVNPTDMDCGIKWCRLANRDKTYAGKVANCNRCLDPHHGGYSLTNPVPLGGEAVELWDCYGSSGQDNQDWLFEALTV